MLYLTLLVYVKPGKEEVFNAYEELVLPLLPAYGGELLSRIRPTADSLICSQPAPPYEVHILTFPSKAHFEAFRQDKERATHAHMFAEAVEKAVLIEGSLPASGEVKS